MAENDTAIERLVLVQLMRLNAKILGLVIGLFFGLAIFIATNVLLIKGGDVIGPHLALLGQFFFGYQVTLKGSIIGFLYGFLVGYIAGYVFARLYNWLAHFRENYRSG
jgi:hypothetical protein